MTARLVESDRDEWHVFNDGSISYLDYVGLIKVFEGPRWRAHGTGESELGLGPVALEAEFASQDEAVEWLLWLHGVQL